MNVYKPRNIETSKRKVQRNNCVHVSKGKFAKNYEAKNLGESFGKYHKEKRQVTRKRILGEKKEDIFDDFDIFYHVEKEEEQSPKGKKKYAQKLEKNNRRKLRT